MSPRLPAGATPAIRTRGLTKRYGHVLAVDSLDLDVPEGARFGFLGPNGSGKTTTVRMLLGLVYASAGEVEVLGHRVPGDASAALRQVGALVEGPAFYGHLDGRRNLTLHDAAGADAPRASRRARVEEALERVALDHVDRRPVKAYSLGMRQRLGIAAALLRKPRLLVLDEPTNGLDPVGIREVRDLLETLNSDGTTVFLSSHLLAEVEQLCDVAAVIADGKLVAQAPVAELLAPTGRVVVDTVDPQAALGALGTMRGVTLLDRDGERLVVALDGRDPAAFNAALVRAKVPVHGFAVERPNLEDVFLSLTGRPREGAR